MERPVMRRVGQRVQMRRWPTGWGVVLDILNNPAIMDTPHALLQQLARARSCLALGVYARAHAVILGGESGNDGEIDLLAACILVQASNQKSNVSHACRAPNIQPLGVLSKALVSWPRQKLTVLVLQVLPEILDRCEVPTPNGPVQGCWLECCAPPFVDLPPESPVLKSVYCMLCCAAAQLHRDASLGGDGFHLHTVCNSTSPQTCVFLFLKKSLESSERRPNLQRKTQTAAAVMRI